MEDGLGLNSKGYSSSSHYVLILVLMEDGLGLLNFLDYVIFRVLILVLMEDGLGQESVKRFFPSTSLNPCFNGRWSRTNEVRQQQRRFRLNPCFNGRWSRTHLLSLPVVG